MGVGGGLEETADMGKWEVGVERAPVWVGWVCGERKGFFASRREERVKRLAQAVADET